MANLVIRGIPDDLQRALRVKTAQEGLTLKELLVPFLELACTSRPIERKGKL